MTVEAGGSENSGRQTIELGLEYWNTDKKTGTRKLGHRIDN